MTPPKNYFHDRLVLLLLTVSSVLAILGSVLVLLRFNPGRNEGYIVQYRANLFINAYKVGHASDLLSFILFFALVMGMGVILSMRVYAVHRQFAVTVLSLSLLLIVVGIIVSNALLILP